METIIIIATSLIVVNAIFLYWAYARPTKIQRSINKIKKRNK